MPEMDTHSSLICHVCIANNATISHRAHYNARHCIHVWLCINQRAFIKPEVDGHRARWRRLDTQRSRSNVALHAASDVRVVLAITGHLFSTVQYTASLVSSHKFHYYSAIPHANSCAKCVRRNIWRLLSSKLAFCSQASMTCAYQQSTRMGARRQVQGCARASPPGFWLKIFLQRCAIAVIKINAGNAGIKSHNTEV